MKRFLKYGVAVGIPIAIVGIALLVLFCVFAVPVVFRWLFPPVEIYSTTDLASYGVITGTNYDKYAKELFAELFPEQIEDYFKDIRYSYTAANIDSWDFEIYLEFVIEDEAKFREYVQSIAPDAEFVPFEYDENYLEYTYSDWYYLNMAEPGDYQTYHAIEDAEIAKVLVNPHEQRIIIVALGVRDGGGIRADYLACFFERFNIDFVEYAERPDYNHEEILKMRQQQQEP